MYIVELCKGNVGVVCVNAVFYELANWSVYIFLNLAGSRVWWSIGRWGTGFPWGGKTRQGKRQRERE